MAASYRWRLFRPQGLLQAFARGKAAAGVRSSLGAARKPAWYPAPSVRPPGKRLAPERGAFWPGESAARWHRLGEQTPRLGLAFRGCIRRPQRAFRARRKARVYPGYARAKSAQKCPPPPALPNGAQSPARKPGATGAEKPEKRALFRAAWGAPRPPANRRLVSIRF